MLRTLEEALQRWTDAALIDGQTAERIRRFEGESEQPSGLRWQVMLALVFGAILLAAGIALFVAAHWDQLSPLWRFVVVMSTLVVIHLLAMLGRERFPWLALVLHGVGTLAAGAGIALVGQIFNIQEHWPGGILLWALCALAGWWLLRKLVSGILFATGAIVLTVTAVGLLDFMYWHDWSAPPPPVALTIFGWGVIVAALLLAWRLKPAALVPAVVVLLVVMVLPHCFSTTEHWYTGSSWHRNDPTFVAYLIVAATACFFSWWGVREKSKALINYGVVAFALTVLWFYFSNIMDKLDRSLSLILLGVLFLGGGWALEKLRRRMVGQVKEATA